MSAKTELKIGSKVLNVSNLDKIFYPKTGFTKADVIQYYIQIAPVLLPHLKDRPLTLKRYPEGVDGFFFYEKQCPGHRPKWLKTTRVASQREEGHIDYCVINGLPALVWAANLADLELHTFLHKAPAIQRPRCVVFDLDPGAPADIMDCAKVALKMKKLLEESKLECWVKTSGSKGLQLYVPLNTSVSYERTKFFAHAVAMRLEREYPALVVSRMQKSLRKGKVLIDWSQNDDHKTTICVYSLRAKEIPSVSTPLTWDEVQHARKASSFIFMPEEVMKRVTKHGDMFAAVLTEKQKLPAQKTVEKW